MPTSLPVPKPDAAARSRLTTSRYSGRSCSRVASRSTMPRILYNSALRARAYFLSFGISSPLMRIWRGFCMLSGSSSTERVSPGMPSSFLRISGMSWPWLRLRSALSTSFT